MFDELYHLAMRNNISFSKWVLIRQNGTDTSNAYKCDYVRSVFANGVYVYQQNVTLGYWWACPLGF